jgi:hypothetical protein
VKRYIIHLLPESSQRALLDKLRGRVAERIGWNRALDYPTTHVTLVYDIQDDENSSDPIDASRLAELLDRVAGSGPIQLWPGPPAIYGEHLLMSIPDSAPLAAIRHTILDGTRQIAAMPYTRYARRAERVKEQSWPHLTFAQEVEISRAQRAQFYLAENGGWAASPILATEVALLTRDLARREPYQIAYQVTL